ncbi:MAG: cache type 2 domain-containing protein [Candidatus Magnetoglobus multicellularis str. Araruama]|uniref:Cache type 2 domain-containing protein n=1 Tax=Candidatus Magnetoglobus multicellularis str. Araruama TaxID=890399 RepID=A0A1V1PAT4_9BACT|nr:MAG: cache type 2 domain-containing protein [Candidatus Magnetoglobus multicellularis str. Araruama]
MLLITPAQGASVTEQEVINLVNQAVKLIQSEGLPAIKKIGDPSGKFYIQSQSLYVFVYDTNCVIKAHPFKPTLVGRSYKGKPDVRGKKFRDDIVNKALTEGSGWTTYSYIKPDTPGIFKKKVFGKLVTVDNHQFIVCCGMYIQ